MNSSEFGGGGDVIARRTTRCSVRSVVLRATGNHASADCPKNRATTKTNSLDMKRAIFSAQQINISSVVLVFGRPEGCRNSARAGRAEAEGLELS